MKLNAQAYLSAAYPVERKQITWAKEEYIKPKEMKNEFLHMPLNAKLARE
jgi:hypothetical protein